MKLTASEIQIASSKRIIKQFHKIIDTTDNVTQTTFNADLIIRDLEMQASNLKRINAGLKVKLEDESTMLLALRKQFEEATH